MQFYIAVALRPGEAFLRRRTESSLVSDNGLSPIRRQTITKTNADLLSMTSLEKESLSEIAIKTQ